MHIYIYIYIERERERLLHYNKAKTDFWGLWREFQRHATSHKLGVFEDGSLELTKLKTFYCFPTKKSCFALCLFFFLFIFLRQFS